mmetsp:Transcript_3608/g.12672  ORF Transcript_3608/g.12672 Transcript_3608/m.12672 type:complete len:225 (+) Transcript_3608:4185-4859(+)
MPVEGRQPEIRDLERRVFVLRGEQEVLRLEVAVNDSVDMARPHDLEHLPDDGRGILLGVVLLGDDPLEELASRAQLENHLDAGLVLKGSLEQDDVGLVLQQLHDLHLPLDVVDVPLALEARLEDDLHGIRMLRALLGAHSFLGAHISGAKGPAAELLAGVVQLLEIGREPEHGSDSAGSSLRGRGRRGAIATKAIPHHENRLNPSQKTIRSVLVSLARSGTGTR